MDRYPNIECQIITGATAAAIKTAFDTWKQSFATIFQHSRRPIIVSISMFSVTDLIVFYYIPEKNNNL